MSATYTKNIEVATLRNSNYRKVLNTTRDQQLVVMSLLPGEDIPLEQHDGSQFIRIEGGTGVVRIYKGRKLAKTIRVKDGSSVVIPSRTKHMIANTSKNKDLKLYSIYTPPQHAPNAVSRRQPEHHSH